MSFELLFFCDKNCCLDQCFDTVGWLKNGIRPIKKLKTCATFPKSAEQMQREPVGGPAIHGSPANNHLMEEEEHCASAVL